MSEQNEDLLINVTQMREASVRRSAKHIAGTNDEKLAIYQCILLEDIDNSLRDLVRQGQSRR